MKRTVQMVHLVFGLCLLGCGGGGSGAVSANFGGVWFGSAGLVDDTCGVVDPMQPYITFNHLVNEDNDRVILDNGAMNFQGARVTESSFKVSSERARPPLESGQTCTETITWRYEAIERKNANFVVRNSLIRCTKEAVVTACEFSFSGSAFQEGFSGPIPIEAGAGGNDFVAEDSL